MISEQRNIMMKMKTVWCNVSWYPSSGLEGMRESTENFSYDRQSPG